ncbi:MAG TPA: hypothetical protein VH165_04165 [Kofleriaceae bacterium]|nr:hypothetical protein [Kofleriaceae bacterium]
MPTTPTPARRIIACLFAWVVVGIGSGQRAHAAPVGAAPPAISETGYQDLRWRMIGPFRGGRTRAAAGVASQPNVFYIAPVNGGIWKTDDAGQTWRPIFDDQPTQSIGAIAVAASNPSIVYAGSGEGLHRPDLSVGNGIYKSLDAGRTWQHLGLSDAQQIPQIAVDPTNPNRVFAAVLGHPYGPSEQRGVFRSLDGGKTWQRVLYKDANTGASDLELDPQHPEIVYAALWEARLGPAEDNHQFQGTGGGLYKSSDGGTTWHKLTRGLPDNAVQYDLAIAPSQPSRLYVELTTTDPDEYGTAKGAGMFRSDDAGASWTRITTDERPMLRIGGGDLMVPVVDPRNPDVVYVASIVAMKSRDGGKTWTWLRGAPGGDDYQNLWINPRDPDRFVLVSDQGANVTVNGGRTWSSWYNQPTAQLYHVGVTADFPYRVCSGQQESGSVCIASRGNDGTIGDREWRPVGIIEYGYAAPDPRNPDVVYGAGRNQVSRYQWSTGQTQNVTPIPMREGYRVERTQPIVFSPLRPGVLYYAANVVFESADGGQRWRTISPDLAHPRPGVPPTIGALAATSPKAAEQRGAVYALAPSFVAPGTLWAGTDDGKLWTTRDGGRHWTDITPAAVTPWSKVTQLDASHFDDATVYASVSRLRLDDLTPYIYRTHDRGKTWSLITAGLPPGPVNAVRADPVRKGLLYAATETGVWVSFDDGAAWQSLQRNLPHTSVRDLVVHDGDLIVATHGRGFWILDGATPLRQLAAAMPDTLFAPAAAYRTPRSLRPDTPIPPDEPTAENPPNGAILDYYLAAPATGPVTLEIADARGTVVRRYTSTDPPELTDDEIARQLIPSYWVRPPRALPTTAGHHRWIWDLRGERPTVENYSYPITAVPHDTPRTPEGPRVLPGHYTVKLTAGGKTLTAALDVRLDPRVVLAPAAVAQQHQLEQHLAELLSRSARLAMHAQSTLDQLAALAPAARSALAQLQPQLTAAIARTTSVLSGPAQPPPGPATPAKPTPPAAPPGPAAPTTPAAPPAEPPPTLRGTTGDLAALYQMSGVDAAPTAVQLRETADAERALAALARTWSAIETTDLAPINAALSAAGLAAIRPELAPTTKQTAGDED